jgi:hypothetical protein
MVYERVEVRNEGFRCEGPQGVLHLTEDCEFPIDFHDMQRMLRRKDLDVAQITLFSM